VNRATVAIDEFCQTGSGSTPPREHSGEYYGGSIPWVKSGELRDGVLTSTEEFVTDEGVRSARLKLVPAGSILVAMYGATVGRTALLGMPATTNQAICHIRPDPSRADARYVWHALQEKLPELLQKRVGGAQPNINQETIKSTRIRLPSLSEQRRTRRHPRQGRRHPPQAQGGHRAHRWSCCASAFLEMFGDPVANPKGWPVRSLDDLCESKQYGTAEKANEAQDGIPVLRMNNLTYAGEVNLSDLKWVPLVEKERIKLDLRDGDVLFNRVNSLELVGKTAVWHHGDGFTFAGYLIRLRFGANAIGDFVSAAMNMPSMKRVILGIAKPSINMANISGSDLARVGIPVPPIAAQQKYKELRRRVLAWRGDLAKHGAVADTLFDSLVARAFSGELST
jgi:type I restriction enzyme S subunit